MNEIGIIEFDYENNVICIYQEKEWHDYSISELKDYLNDIQSQLATYKDKEDKIREYINRNAKENKELMEKYKEKINKLNKYDLTELLELSNQEAFHKAWYMCSARALEILNEGE